MTNCDWFNSKLEAYFCDDLNSEELQRCQTHLATCAACRQEVESLRDIDTGIRQVFERRLHLARLGTQTPARSRPSKLAWAGAGLTVAAIVLGLSLPVFRRAPEPAEAPQASIGLPPSIGQVVKDKSTESTGTHRTKPEKGVPTLPAPQPNLDSVAPDGPEFALTDAAGYTVTLDTYRGRVLLFGVVSSGHKTAMTNLQQVYDAFGSNPEIRILAVSRRDDELAGATFPRYFNHGSKLLGVQEGDFLLIDAAGNSRLEGSLEDAASVTRLRTELAQMGIR